MVRARSNCTKTSHDKSYLMTNLIWTKTNSQKTIHSMIFRKQNTKRRNQWRSIINVTPWKNTLKAETDLKSQLEAILKQQIFKRYTKKMLQKKIKNISCVTYRSTSLKTVMWRLPRLINHAWIIHVQISISLQTRPINTSVYDPEITNCDERRDTWRASGRCSFTDVYIK